jgi:pilus assembly protein Flp/PilA
VGRLHRGIGEALMFFGNLAWSRLGRQPGQGMVEYALILVLVAVVLVVILLTMGRQIGNVFSNVAATIGCYAGPGGGQC